MPDDNITVQLLLGKVDSIQRKTDELVRITRQGKWTGRLMILLIALGAFFSLWRTYQAVRNYPPQLYTHYASQEALKLQPVFQQHLNRMMKNLSPVYDQAFQKEFTDRMPEIAGKASAEANKYMVNVGDRLQAELNKSLEGVVKKHAQALAKENPELKDEQVRANVTAAAQDIYYAAAQDVVKEVFAPHTTALANLSATVETFEIPDDIKKMNDEKLVAYTKDTLMQVLARRLNFFETPETPAAVPAKPAGR